MNSNVTSQVGPLNELLGAMGTAISGAGVDQQMLTKSVAALKAIERLFGANDPCPPRKYFWYYEPFKYFVTPLTAF
jgi:hypothetical protein